MPSFFHKAAAVLAACATSVSGHIIMANPVPYGKDTINNSPLTSSNYPCQVTGDAASFYSTDGISNTATAGEAVSMSFTGSAVHGGGSCQVALSTDMQPSASTRWSVILSIEGGCPTKDGSSTGTYDVTIPSDVPAGTYSYAWTWTSKMSGTQEYYMNCAPITIKASGGSKKRSQSIRARAEALEAFPPLAVYNLADINSCKSVLSSDPQYPVPGTNVEHDLASGSYAYEAITGSDCFATGVSYSASGSSDDSSSGSSNDDSSNDDSSNDDSSSDSGSSDSTPTSTSTGAATDVPAGGVFAPSGASAPSATPTGSSSGTSSDSSGASGSSGSSSSSDSSGSSGSYDSSSGSATMSASVPTATGSSSSSSGSSSSGSSSSGSSSSGSSSSGSTSPSGSSSNSSSSGSCTAGDYECSTDGSSYKMCVAGGGWSVSMSMAAGTACTPGTSSGLTISAVAVGKVKRAFRLY